MNVTSNVPAVAPRGELQTSNNGTGQYCLYEKPPQGSANSTYRLPGIVYLRQRKKPTPAQAARRVKRIREQQAKAGIVAEWPLEAKTREPDLWTWVCQGANWLWQSVPPV